MMMMMMMMIDRVLRKRLSWNSKKGHTTSPFQESKTLNLRKL